jgi:hypothetical protein
LVCGAVILVAAPGAFTGSIEITNEQPDVTTAIGRLGGALRGDHRDFA